MAFIKVGNEEMGLKVQESIDPETRLMKIGDHSLAV